MDIPTMENLVENMTAVMGSSYALFDDHNHRVKVVAHHTFDDAITYIRKHIQRENIRIVEKAHGIGVK
jgi:hypothetical protein